MKTLLVLVLSLVISACSTTTEFIPVEKKIVVDAENLQRCRPLVDLPPLPSYSFADILDNIGKNAIIFRECANRQDTSIEIIKKLTK